LRGTENTSGHKDHEQNHRDEGASRGCKR